MVIPLQRFPSSWLLKNKMGPIGCTETSVRNYHNSLRNMPEELRFHFLCDGSLKSRINGTLHEEQYKFIFISPSHFFWEWEMFHTEVVEKIKTRILCSITLFQKACHIWDNVEKYCRAGQTTGDNMAYAHCMLGI